MNADANVCLNYQYRGWRRASVLGPGASIRSGTVIYADCRFGRDLTCGHNVVIRANVRGGHGIVVLHGSILEGNIKLGHYVKIMAQVYVCSRTVIGDRVFIGPGTVFLNDRFPMRHRGGLAGVRVGSGAMVGGGVTLCPGVTVGHNAFVGAGSVVTKNVPPNRLAIGNPARCYPLPPGISPTNLKELIETGRDLWGLVK